MFSIVLSESHLSIWRIRRAENREEWSLDVDGKTRSMSGYQ